MRKGLPRIVILLWSIIILIIGGLAAFYFQGESWIPAFLNNISPTPIKTTAYPTTTPSSLPPALLVSIPPPEATPSPLPPSSTPAIPQPQVIGHSVAGRPLEVYQFGYGPVEKMIVAGIHGGYEYNTIILADELISYLESHQEIIPPDHTLFILRAFNPDGFERSRGFGGRANENNVDLNRNFPSNWKIEWPRPGCWDYIPITGGTSAASEPETQALMAFVKAHDLKAFISYHSAALGIFPGGQPPDQGSLSLAETIAGVSPYPYPPIDAGCMFTGQLVDWVSDQGIAGVDIELTNHQDSDFEINLGILSVFLDWSYPE
jgi:predicted deacylase